MSTKLNIKQYLLEDCRDIDLAAPTFKVVYTSKGDVTGTGAHHGQLKCQSLNFPFARSAVISAPLREAKTLVEADLLTHTKRVVEIMLDIKHLAADYQPGDTIGILPCNSEEEVQQLLETMKLADKADHNCQIQLQAPNAKKSTKLPPHIPTTTTPREILRDCLNLRAVVRKQFLRQLAECCTVDKERLFFNSLAAKEGSSYYSKLILERGYTLLDLLASCPSCRPTLELLVEQLPRLLPRPYSIANSPLAQESEIRIIFSLLNRKPGVTTSMLDRLARQLPTSGPPLYINIYLRETSNFRYTAENEALENQILMAIGTGLAPFLGFLQHKQHLVEFSLQSRLGKTWLFVGSGKKSSILHREQLLEWQQKRILGNYFESLSCVADAEFHYIQEQMEANGPQLVEFLLRPNTILYVCADGAQISKSIEKALAGCLMKQLKLPEAEALAMLKDLRAKNKYREDVWL